VHIRQIAVEAGFLPRILERLGGIAGEKPRELEEADEIDSEEIEEIVLERKKSNTKNVDKKKRKGVGYSASQGV